MWLSIVFTRWPRSYTKYFYEPNYNVPNDFNSRSYEPFHKSQWIISMDYTNAIFFLSFVPFTSRKQMKYANEWNATSHVNVQSQVLFIRPGVAVVFRFCIVSFWKVAKEIGESSWENFLHFSICWIRFYAVFKLHQNIISL